MAERMHWLGQDSTEQDARIGIGALFAAGSGLAVAPGVLSGLAVAQTGAASTSVQVAIGRALNQATSSIGGAYLEALDAAKTLDIIGAGGLAPGANPRRDLIVYESGLALGSRVHRVQGTPAAVPVDPAVPAQAIVLARVRVKTSAAYGGSVVIVNADIDDLRTYTGLNVPAPVLQTAGISGANSFAAHGAGGFAGLYATKDDRGRVQLHGELTGSNATTGKVIATIPAGFRPAAAEMFAVSTRTAGLPAYAVYVNTLGEVVCQTNSTGGITAIGLSSISYYAA